MTDRIDDDPLDDDLVAKFAQLDRMEPPDNWQRATERVGAPHGGDSSHRWWAAAAAAVLVVGGVIGVAATRGGEAPLQESAPTAAPVTSVPEADVVEPAVSEPPVAEPSVPATDVEGGVDTAVSDADDTVAVPVVEGLTEGQAVQTLRSLDFVVSVERTEVMPGDPNDGRVVSQDPLAATVLSTGDEIKIVIGQATIAATDQLAQTLTRFGADLATAPTEATSLDGAMFCGSEQLSNQVDRSVTMDVVGRRCLLDHHAARLPAVFVTESSTDEGDPIVVVMRTRADGTAESFVDSTRDDFGSGEWSSKECGRFVDLTSSTDGAFDVGCDDRFAPLTEPITVEPLPFPAWFQQRTPAPDCGYFSSPVDDPGPPETRLPLGCMADAIENGETAELVTVHVGDGLRVARWIVSLGPSPQGTPQFEVASLVVDLREGTTRWAETRCVEGDLVDGRLVGDFIVDRDRLDQLDPSGTVVSDDGTVVDEPGPDDRGSLQPCNGPQRVERPDVSPFEATGLRTGDVGSPRFADFNEVGEYDVTVVTSWMPVGLVDVDGVIGFLRSDSLEFPPSPEESVEFDEQFRVIYADDGVTRIGEFGPEGSAILDS